MPPRKSDARHRLAGTYRPDRHGRPAAPPPAAAGPLEPPADLPKSLASIWRELAGEAPWLSARDRAPLELAVRAFAELRASASPSPALLAQVGAALDRLGLSPKARGETTAIEPQRPKAPRKIDRYVNPPNEFDEF